MHTCLLKEAKGMQQKLVSIRRALHSMPETGFHLPETFAFVKESLQQLGLVPEKTGRCGLTACIGNGEPVVLLRADMDALPVKEESGLPFAAQNGCAHACGHDMHTTMLLGAAALLVRHRQALHGCVKLMFQPAEELLAGAADMIRNGLFEPVAPKAALMLHVMSVDGLAAGTVVVPPGGISAPYADLFRIRVRGKGCHGAMPHTGIDPIQAGAHILLSLQSLSAREVSMLDAHVLTVCSFQTGESANVIPDAASLQGSVRSFDQETQRRLKHRIEETAGLTAKAHRADAKTEWFSGCPALRNDQQLVKLAEDLLPSVLGKEKVLAGGELPGGDARSVGSEDFATISERIPSLMLAVAAGTSPAQPLHHPSVVFDEEALAYGAAAYAAFALELLKT